MTQEEKLKYCDKTISKFNSYKDMDAYRAKIYDKMLWDNKIEIVKVEVINNQIIIYYLYYVLGKAKNKADNWRI